MNASARLMHQVKIGARLLTVKQARELDSLRRGLIPPGSQGLDERPEGTVAIKLMRPRPQDLKAVCELRQTRIDQAGLPDSRLTLDQHDPPAPHASVPDGVPQDPKLALPTENQPPAAPDRIPETFAVKSRRALSPNGATDGTSGCSMAAPRCSKTSSWQRTRHARRRRASAAARARSASPGPLAAASRARKSG
jgi:hypothetical protein